MEKKAELHYEGQVFEIPVVTGTENENALDISKLRVQSGLITLDRGFKNTGSCESSITFLNGEEGILRYRGYSIEELAEKSTFLEVSFLLIYIPIFIINLINIYWELMKLIKKLTYRNSSSTKKAR